MLGPYIATIFKESGVDQALIDACGHGELFELNTLLSMGAQPVGLVGSKALASAVRKNRFIVVEILIENGAADDLGPEGETALMIAVNRGFEPCVELLLPRAVNLSWLNREGRCILEEAKQFSFDPSRDRIAEMIESEIRLRRVKAEAEAIAQASGSSKAMSTLTPRL